MNIASNANSSDDNTKKTTQTHIAQLHIARVLRLTARAPMWLAVHYHELLVLAAVCFRAASDDAKATKPLLHSQAAKSAQKLYRKLTRARTRTPAQNNESKFCTHTQQKNGQSVKSA